MILNMTYKDQELAEQYMPLAASLARKFSGRVGTGVAPDTENYEGAAFEALCRAAGGYDGDRGSFQAFATRAITNSLIDCLRADVKEASGSLEDLGDGEEEYDWQEQEVVEDDQPSPEEDAALSEEVDLMYYQLDRITLEEKRVLSMLYGLQGADAMTTREVGTGMGISHAQVMRIRDLALVKMRNRMDV